MKYAFIAEHVKEFSVKIMCRVLGVSRSGYYAWKDRPVSPRSQENTQLLGLIRGFHERSRATYGSPRIWADLRDELGIRCSRKRVARLMHLHNIHPRRRRRYKVTTRAAATHSVAPNLLAQDFTATRLNEKWLADITYIDTQEGRLYLASILDTFSRRIVGWSMGTHMRTQLVENALCMAVGQRRFTGDLLHHSDRGSQFTSHNYLGLLEKHGITVSMSRSGNCYDNAMKESFFATLKNECADERFPTRDAARQAIFEYIELWYNRQRRHSALGYLSPHTFEQLHA
jgi:transposase InsO family protein